MQKTKKKQEGAEGGKQHERERKRKERRAEAAPSPPLSALRWQKKERFRRRAFRCLSFLVVPALGVQQETSSHGLAWYAMHIEVAAVSGTGQRGANSMLMQKDR